MKKLQELKEDELKNLLKNNDGVSQLVYDKVYEDAMEQQSFEYDEIFGENNKTISWHSNYYSFYLRLEDAERFVGNIKDIDYFTADNLTLYDNAKKLADEWEDMTYDEQQDNDDLYNRLKDACEKLLAGIEEQLHEFEKGISEEEMLEYAVENREWLLDDLETDGEKVYKNIVKVYE